MMKRWEIMLALKISWHVLANKTFDTHDVKEKAGMNTIVELKRSAILSNYLVMMCLG